MNRTKQSKWVAIVCMAALAGCASDQWANGSSSGANTGYTAPGSTAASSGAGTSSASSKTSGETGSSTAGTGSGGMSGSGSMGSGGTGSTGMDSTSSTGSTGSTSTTGSTGGTGSMGTGSGSATAQTSYGTVQAIDQMQRQDVGVGALGAAAAGGAMAGSPTDRVYRVNVRMDDGSSQLIVVDSMPSFKVGDRVRYNNGTLSSY